FASSVWNNRAMAMGSRREQSPARSAAFMGSSSVRRMLLLVVLVANVLSGCGGGDDGAGDSVKDVVTSLSISDYAGAWDSLHPAQQRVVPKDLFIRCGVEGENANDPAIENLKVL